MNSDPSSRQETAWLSARLCGAAEPWQQLGFAGQDLADVRTAIATLLADESATGRLARERAVATAGRLAETLGGFERRPTVFGSMEEEAYEVPSIPGHGWGIVALVALAAAVPEVRRFHQGRGVPDKVSWESLADLGQQVRVHRETYGRFGLHAQGWLVTIWSGALYSMGRLQFNLQWYEPKADDPDHPVADPTPRWVVSTHIPGTGPLTPEAADTSFARGRAFFAEHFADFPTREFYCGSWLLDPRMARLDPASNTARFQARWQLDGPSTDGNTDAYFFLWRRRGEVDPATLPTDSSLRRLVVSEITAGRPWQITRGLIPYGV
ncbi:acyltransferase domain-containing protein [Propionibacteriaceae bacterium Y2011]